MLHQTPFPPTLNNNQTISPMMAPCPLTPPPLRPQDNPELWSTTDVVQWLGAHGFAEYAPNFAAERITGPLLLHDMDQDILIELGVDDQAAQQSMLSAINALAIAVQSSGGMVSNNSLSQPPTTSARQHPIPTPPHPQPATMVPRNLAAIQTGVAATDVDRSGSGEGYVKKPRSQNKDRLSPSAAQRWMACPPSHRYEQQFPEQPSSIYAEEGSFAHSLAELELEHQLGTISAALYSAELEAHKENEWYSLVLQGHVDAYVSYALQTIAEAQASSATPVMVKVEDSVRVVGWAPTVKGTADLLLVSDTEVHIIDFKYGRVRMSVFQPRVFPGPQTIAMPAEELLYWAEHELQGAASLALAGKGDFAAGSHCRF
eukprot:gene11999-35354_t